MHKFTKIRIQNQIAIEKHLELNNDLLTSSEDEVEDIEQVQKSVDQIMSSYEGQKTDAEKMLSFLINTFQSGGTVCLICISTIKKIDAIWNCDICYTSIHISCILHWIRDSLKYKRENGISPVWACPKCRTDYGEDEIPTQYQCFCGKTVDPVYQPWNIPHSCGEICGKILKPECGHKCVLLCHPGPCPPCAKMVSQNCYCEKEMQKPRRCNSKFWSCGKICDKKYNSCSHRCKEICHEDSCPPCSVLVSVKCNCAAHKEDKFCHDREWKCKKPCNKLLSCNIHICKEVCHKSGDCGSCLIERNRTCPCGKKRYNISCKQQYVPTCGDTCGKLLECGSHYCNMRCHTDNCGQCLEIVEKTCRCESYKKEIACTKEFHCNKKCSQLRLCGKHQCNRKCCDCLIKNIRKACEKMCNSTLSCKKHKCASSCHSGPCYPCFRTDTIQCRCGNSKITVPCGTRKRIKPPPCYKMCKIPPRCHHLKRESHRCHQGNCPPCKKICNLTHENCGHLCPVICHTEVLTKVKLNGVSQPAGPWEKEKFGFLYKTSPCPPCEVSIMVTCLGGHETLPWPCHSSTPTSCQRPCGRLLNCKNHSCKLLCHKFKTTENSDGIPCSTCEEPCSLPRPQGCIHLCPKPCHEAPCQPCNQLVRISCHCGIGTLYKRCKELTSTTLDKVVLLKCGNQCPKNYPCGHRCIQECHPGSCKNSDICNKKVKVFCKCKRIKKDYLCYIIQKENIIVLCDASCDRIKEEKERAREIALAQQRQAENLRNQEEVMKFERKFRPRRKGKDKNEKKSQCSENNSNFSIKFIVLAFILLLICISISYFSFLYKNEFR